MQRIIKFRAWHREKKCWLDGVRIYNDGSWSGSIIEERGEIDGYDGRECELMQYTGLKDRKSKEIYEGDIVRLVYALDMGQWTKYGDIVIYVRWSDSQCGRYPVVCFKYIESTEVIGNIYENPELLKEMR